MSGEQGFDEQAAIAAWHDVDEHGRPILFYEVRSLGRDPLTRRQAYGALTEPCIYCGRRHHHGAGYDGDGDGSRVPHCGVHTHDRTRTGRPRSPYARGVTTCYEDHREYVLQRRPEDRA